MGNVGAHRKIDLVGQSVHFENNCTDDTCRKPCGGLQLLLNPILSFFIGGLQIEGVLAYLKCQKRIGDDVGDLKSIFTKKFFWGGENDPPDTFYPTYYD
jgi:hypothetical protein